MRTRYLCGWLIVVAVILVDTIWLRLAGYSVQMGGLVVAGKVAGILVSTSLLLRMLRAIPRYESVTVRFRYAETSDVAAWCALLVCFVSSICVLSYLCVSINTPLVEGSLIRFDLAVGFNWVAAYHFVQSHPHVQRILALAYASGRWQLLAVPFVLGLSGRREALPDFFFLLVIASVLLLVSSTPFPATSAFVHFNVGDPNLMATVSDFAPLRNGTLRSIDLTHSQGLVSMPSFHTALAVLFTYSLRRIPWVFGFAGALNLAMIISTPTQGGHYLADVFGGVVLAALTIQILQMFYRRRTARTAAVPTIESVAL
ncbi:phosphatase PAP2 family protein [Paraburkholderia sp. GAS41]|uniref:phosphatase PAP2 family protein n=1 Tax=Paraburkholderia sp. GAS41 TaxID=3035134 RepID=UPI003D24A7D0